jgi:CRP-like cAMP-binding protein
MKLNLIQMREQGDQLRAAGEHLSAIRVYLAILKRSPEDYETRLLLGEALERIEAVAEATKVNEAVARHCIACGRPLVAIVACRAMEAHGKRTEHLLLELASCYGKGPKRKAIPTGQHTQVSQEELKVDAKELRRECTVAELVQEALTVGTDLAGLDDQPLRYVAVPLLSELTPPTLVNVIKTMLVHRLPAGHVVFQQGQPGQSCFLLVRGSIRVLLAKKGGEAAEVANLSDGAIFGEMSLITGSERSATVEVTEETDLLELGPEALGAIGEELGGVAKALDRLAEKRWMANLMRQSPVFAAFNEEERLELLKHFQAHQVPEGTMLLKQGLGAPGIYLVLRGEVGLSKRGDDGAQITSTLGPSATIGLSALLNDEPSPHKATALTPATVLYMPAESVFRLIEAVPEFARAIRDSAPPL